MNYACSPCQYHFSDYARLIALIIAMRMMAPTTAAMIDPINPVAPVLAVAFMINLFETLPRPVPTEALR